MVGEQLFRPCTREEAKYCIDHWHRNAHFSLGTDFYGVESNGELIAAAVFMDATKPDMGELVATVKKPDIQFQISRLLKYCRKQLRNKYKILVTFFDASKSNGGQAKGDYWNYHGKVINKSMEPGIHYHFFWIAINKQGINLAKSLGLEANPYPK